MTIGLEKRILAGVTADKFVGRDSELEAILAHARSDSPNGLSLLSAPGLGTSELLRQAYDRLFNEQAEIVPFYFAINKSDASATRAARSFLRQFLLQAVAFRRRDAALVNSSIEITELADLAMPSDGAWIGRLLELCGGDDATGDLRHSLRTCLSGPARAAASGVRVCAMIDGLEETANLEDGDRFLHEIDEVFSRAGVAYVFAARRRFELPVRRRKTLNLEPLSFADSGKLAEALSSDLGVAINDQTRDLMVVLLQGNPSQIDFLFESAVEKGSDLNSFRAISSVYAREILRGRIGRQFDSIFDEASLESASRRRVLEFLCDAGKPRQAKTTVGDWQRLSGMPDDQFRRMIDVLNVNELVRLTSNTIEPETENIVISDCIASRYKLEVESKTPTLVTGELMTESLKRAPRLMAKLYRRDSSLGVRELMSAFDCQQVPSILFDYGRFRDAFKGLADADVIKALINETDKLTLPQIVFAESASSFYSPIAAVADDDRAAVATGFIESKYTDDDQIAWIAAEIDSKLETTRELAEFWCDRLEMVAVNSGFQRFQLWLIAPEGFAPEALELLKQRNAFGSSRKQAGLLKRQLNLGAAEAEATPVDEYEIVVPMGEDTELIAAHAVEEIARRHKFPQKAINQIKTALVEACINAAEHSLSPDRKIYQKFTVDADRINITVSNRGIRFANENAVEIEPSGGRRGWGLSLMRGLMDEVRFEQVDDGTRITMTKFLHSRL